MMRRLLWLFCLTPALAYAQEPIPQAQAGSLYPFIEAQVPADFPLSFLNPRHTSLETWQRQARAEVRSLLHYDPPKCDPRPEVVERVDCGGYVREKLYFNTAPEVRVPAYVLVPKGGPARKPAILLLHDHGAFFVWGKEKLIGLPDEHPALTEFKRTSYGGRSVGDEFARRGYVVMAIDMFYWGERRMVLPGDPPRETMSAEEVAAINRRASASTGLAATGLFEAGVTWAGVMLTDDLRSLDVLASRPDVDPERLGCCGLSVGGFRSAHLAGLDPRIKVAVVVGWMCSYPAMLQSHLTSIGPWAFIPGLQQRMDLPDVVSMHAPGPLMVIHGTQDRLFPMMGVQQAFDNIEAVYAKAGARGRFRAVTYDGPHEFNRQMQEKTFGWFDRWL